MTWEGVPSSPLRSWSGPSQQATHVFFKSLTATLPKTPLDVCLDDDVLIAHKWNDKPFQSSTAAQPAS